MYDLPGLGRHWDTVWTLVRERLLSQGIDAPRDLTRSGDPWQDWQDPDLVLSQTCGLPFRAKLMDRVSLIGTPDFGLPDAPAGHYFSVLIARTADARQMPGADPGARLAINDPLSQSGWCAAWTWATARDVDVGPVLVTGSHAASAGAVANGLADWAAIDAVTWDLLSRTGATPPGLRVFGRTPTGPGLPMITASRDPSRHRTAVKDAFERLPEATRRALGIRGLIAIPASDYAAMPLPPVPKIQPFDP